MLNGGQICRGITGLLREWDFNNMFLDNWDLLYLLGFITLAIWKVAKEFEKVNKRLDKIEDKISGDIDYN